MDTKRSFFRTVEAHLQEKIIPKFDVETKTDEKMKKID